MDYRKHYNHLINRARNRTLVGYIETHHIVPRCMGGDNSKSNLVDLTPEEHYVAHQLLAKIYPKKYELTYSAVRMASSNTTQKRNNKLYGWLRRRLSNFQKIRMVNDGNPMFDKRWVANNEESILVEKEVAEKLIAEGLYIAGKYAIIAECGHLVRTRCAECENRKALNYRRKKEEGKKLAEDLFEKFMQSNCRSVGEFAKIEGTTQPRLSVLWKKHIPEYRERRKQGKSFKQGL